MDRLTFLLIFTLILSFCAVPPGRADDESTPPVLTRVRRAKAPPQAAANADSTYVRRRGLVHLDTGRLTQSIIWRREQSGQPSRKRTLQVALFPDRVYRVVVGKVLHPGSGITTWKGRLENGRGSFTLVTSGSGYMLTLRDGTTLFRLSGDIRTGDGVVREIALDRLPPAYDGPPVIRQSKEAP